MPLLQLDLSDDLKVFAGRRAMEPALDRKAWEVILEPDVVVEKLIVVRAVKWESQ